MPEPAFDRVLRALRLEREALAAMRRDLAVEDSCVAVLSEALEEIELAPPGNERQVARTALDKVAGLRGEQ